MQLLNHPSKCNLTNFGGTLEHVQNTVVVKIFIAAWFGEKML